MITDSRVPESEVRPYECKWEDGLVVLMDCGGSNAVKVDEQLSEANPAFGGIKLLGTGRGPDHEECKAREKRDYFAEKYPNLAFVEHDFRTLEQERGVAPGDVFRALRDKYEGIPGDYKGKFGNSPAILGERAKTCSDMLDKIKSEMKQRGISDKTRVFLAGFMQLVSGEFIRELNNPDNVHPGDVTKYSLDGVLRGKRTIVGDGWIPPAKAISAGHENLYSSMHQIVEEMDAGAVYMRGNPLFIDYNRLLSKVDISDKAVLKQVGEIAQEALKHIGDHVIAGATFMDLFNGNWGVHEPSGDLAYRFDDVWYRMPNGITTKTHVDNYGPDNTVFYRSDDFIRHHIHEFEKEVEVIGGK